MLLEFDAHQQAAIRSTKDAEVARRRDLSRREVLRDRIEVVIDALAMGLEAGLVPRRTELAAASRVSLPPGFSILDVIGHPWHFSRYAQSPRLRMVSENN